MLLRLVAEDCERLRRKLARHLHWLGGTLRDQRHIGEHLAGGGKPERAHARAKLRQQLAPHLNLQLLAEPVLFLAPHLGSDLVAYIIFELAAQLIAHLALQLDTRARRQLLFRGGGPAPGVRPPGPAGLGAWRPIPRAPPRSGGGGLPRSPAAGPGGRRRGFGAARPPRPPPPRGSRQGEPSLHARHTRPPVPWRRC